MTEPVPAPPQLTSVLFADPDHGPRAQMAESVLRALDRASTLQVASAGTVPGGDLTGVAGGLHGETRLHALQAIAERLESLSVGLINERPPG